MLKRYGEAVRLFRECTSRLPNEQWPHLRPAAAYAKLGQLEEARAEAAEVLRINRGFTIESYKRLVVFKHPKDAEHFLDGLYKAGLPESCALPAFRGAYAALLTPQKNGSGPFTIPLTFLRQAWYSRKKPVGA